MAVVIKIHGLDKLSQKIERMGKDISTELETATKKAILYVHSHMPAYPPEPKTSRYQRTGLLGRSVTTMQGQAEGALSRIEKIDGSEVVGIIGTNVVYAPFVIDTKRQKKVHRGRWWTLQQVVEEVRDKIIEIYRDAIRDLVRR